MSKKSVFAAKRLRSAGLVSVALLANGCSGLDDASTTRPQGTAPELEAASYEAPRELSYSEGMDLWRESVSLDRYERSATTELTDDEQQSVLDALDEQGFDAAEARFVGANVWFGDVFVDVRPALEALRESSTVSTVSKGKVLNEIVTAPSGPRSLQTAPARYARQEQNGNFVFNRPEVSGFITYLVVPDSMSTALVNLFTQAVQDIGAAATTDCLGAQYLRVIRKAAFTPIATAPFATPVRSIVVEFSANPCNGRAGCAQFPQLLNVALSPASPFPGGGGGVAQRRFLFGSYVALDSNQIGTGTAAARQVALSVITHELMHTLGVAHPTDEALGGSGAIAAKLTVPGTSSSTTVASIMASSATLTADDNDVINTLYNSGVAPGCNYQTASIVIVAR